jgi:hypothetical protein
MEKFGIKDLGYDVILLDLVEVALALDEEPKP